MKKIGILIILFWGINLVVKGQMLVADPAMIITLKDCHNDQQRVLNSINDSEKEIRNYQMLIGIKMEQISALQEKTYNYLSTVNSVVKNSKDIVYASQIAVQIAEYQKEAFELATGDGELLLVAAKTEYELITRSADLMIHIYGVALANGENNLLDNKQRLDLCFHVVEELKRMRALAYSVCRQIRSAKRNGILKTLSPGSFKYINNGAKRVENILSNIKF